MSVDLVLRRRHYSPDSFWKLDGFAADLPCRVFISPIPSGGASCPPYHLDCVIPTNSHTAQQLLTASDYNHSPVTDADIECIADQLVDALQDWSAGRNLPEILPTLPMGSKFVVEECAQPRKLSVWLCPNLELQRRYLESSRLRQLWGSLPIQLPPSVDMESLKSVARLHDSVSIVLLPNGDKAIFKGAVRIVARFYHELRELLRLPPHPNIVSKPMFLVTRRMRKTANPIVCGFLLPLHSGGTVLQAITRCPDQPLPLEIKVKWIRQIISAFTHIHGPGNGFYSDLRLDNMVLDSDGDVVLVDFEQAGSPSRWIPPEASLEPDASSPEDGDAVNWAVSRTNPVRMPLGIFYSNPAWGYWKTFAAASDRQRQAMECYTIAKVIWCIFEEETNNLSLADLDGQEMTLRRDDGTLLKDSVFPHFSKTPLALRHWIWVCTKKSKEWGSARCKCTEESPAICGDSGALVHNGAFEARPGYPGPIIANMHQVFEAWAVQ